MKHNTATGLQRPGRRCAAFVTLAAAIDRQGVTTERPRPSELRRAARLSRRLLAALPGAKPQTAAPPGGMPPAPTLVHPVLEPWQEGEGVYHSGRDEPDARPGWISWSTQPRFDASVTLGRTRVDSRRSEPFSLDITELVREWLSGARPNYGLVLVGEGEGPASYKIGITSSESKHVEQQPQLVVTSR